MFAKILLQRRTYNFNLSDIEDVYARFLASKDISTKDIQYVYEAVRRTECLVWHKEINCFKGRRYGPDFDGGYMIPEGVAFDYVISAGIGKNSQFEQQLAKEGHLVLALDPTVEDIPHNHQNILHTKLFLKRNSISGRCTNLREVLESINSSSDFLLKMDIEGDELEILVGLEEFQDKISILAVEFHNWYKVANVENRSQINETLDILENFFFATTCHSNNWRNLINYGEVIFPDVFEVTFVNKKYREQLVKSSIPNKIYANNPRKPDIPEGFIKTPTLRFIQNTDNSS